MLMDRFIGSGFFIFMKVEFFTQNMQLAMRITPFAQAHKRQKMLAAPFTQLVLGQLLPLFFVAEPEIDQT